MKQLGFVQWQVSLIVPNKNVTVELPSFFRQLPLGAEQAGVVGHVEHRRESHSPRIRSRPPSLPLPPKDAGIAVHLARDLHVPAGAEDRTGTRVRVEQCEVLGGQSESTLRLRQLLHLMQEERELRFQAGSVGTAERQQAELVGAVHP